MIDYFAYHVPARFAGRLATLVVPFACLIVPDKISTSMPTDTSLLQAALIEYEAEKQRIENAIVETRRQLGMRKATGIAKSGGHRKSDGRCPRPRRNVCRAQRKRWAAYRKAQAA